jgi:hypothetical protein
MTALSGAQIPIPSTVWTHPYIWSYVQQCYGVRQTADGGHVLAGHTSGWGAGSFDVFLMKIDAHGDSVWFRTYGGTAADYCYSLTSTTDGGYALAGWTTSFGGGTDLYLVKTDSVGNLQWQHNYGISYDDVCHCVRQTSDGGFILGGSCMQGWDNMYLVKTDSQGNLQWQHSYGGNFVDRCYAISQTTDGGYILGGSFGYASDSTNDAWLLKTNSSGTPQWDYKFGGVEYDEFHAVEQAADGGYIASGTTDSFGNLLQIYLVKTDSMGYRQWQNNYGGPAPLDDICYTVLKTPDKGYLLSGMNGYNFNVLKVDSSGNQLWTNTITSYALSQAFDISQDNDGSYTLAGVCNNYDILAVHISGLQQAWVHLDPTNPPINIPAQGGSFQYTISLTNCGTVSCRPAVWVMVTLPTGHTYGPALGPISVALDTAATVTRLRTQTVPGSAPAGVYTYKAYIGTYQGAKWDSSSFTFTKLGDSGQAGMTEGDWTCTGEPFPGEEAVSSQPSDISLSCSPNPFNPTTTISYILSHPQHVNLSVYNLLGSRLATLVDGLQQPGSHVSTWDAKGKAAGVYLVRLESEVGILTKKMVVVK